MAVVQVLEQFIRIGLVIFLLGFAPSGDLEKSCTAVSAGSTAAEVFSFLLIMAVFIHDRRKHGKKVEPSPRLPARMLGIAVPLALSAYA